MNQQFRGRPCEEFISDLRVKIEVSGLYTYADVVALCQPPRFEDDQLDTLTNPEVVFEVLSESTETYDRGRKFAQYRMLPSLAEYILVAQDRVSVEHFKRQENGSWLLRPLSESTDVLNIGTIDCQLSLADVYAKVELPSSAAGAFFPR